MQQFKVTPSFKWIFFLPAIAAIIVRGLPEYKIGVTPVGYDVSTSYLEAFLTYKGSLLSSLSHFSFLYYFFELAHTAGLDALLTLKITGVLLYAGLVTCFFLLLKDVFKLGDRFSVFGAILFTFQLSSLRLSWDLFRNETGLIFGMLCIWQFYLWRRDKKRWRIPTILLTGLLTLGSHQMASFLLIIVIVSAAVTFSVQRITSNRSLVVLALLTLPQILVLVAPHITTGHLALWYHFDPTTNQNQLPLDLATLLFFPLIIVALIGITTSWFPTLLLITLILTTQSFATIILKDEGFFLWDRWMYLLGVPLSIYALLGIKWISATFFKSAVLRYSAYIIVLGMAIYPAYRFIHPKETLYPSNVSRELFDMFPGAMMTNSFIAHQAERNDSRNLESCLRLLEKHYDGESLLIAEQKYHGIVRYYIPSLVPKMNAYLETASSLPSYYLITYNSKLQGSLLPPEGFNSSCPIRYKSDLKQ